MPWVGKWIGGRIWKAADGTLTYWIRRKVDGRPYNLSTRCTSERAAVKHLERFEADPSGYSPGGVAGDLLALDEDLSRAFLKWSRDVKGNGSEWVGKQKRYLAWWAKQLGRRDLRRVSLRDHIRPALDKTKGQRQRIEVIKALYGWLRRERDLVTPAQDPTYGTLSVPQGRPEQWKTPKPIPPDHHVKALLALPQPYRDMLAVLDDTGWHVTELARFIRAGSMEAMPAGREGEAAAVLVCPRRKSGETQRTAVSSSGADAARRLRARGTFSRIRLYRAVAAACDKAEVPRFTPGRYRHTLATREVEAGADPASVAAFLGHKSSATTRRFYATLAVVPRPKGHGR
jgi:integrase